MWERLLSQNGLGGEAIIWLIIAFFWVLAQVFSKAKEARRQREQTTGDQPLDETGKGDKTFERQMREFFEQIGAEEAETEPASSQPRHDPPSRASRAERHIRRTPPPVPAEPRVRLHPPPDTTTRPKAASLPDIESRLGEMDTRLDESALDTEAAYALRETRNENLNAFVNPRTLLVNLNYLRMNMPIVPIRGLETTDAERPRPSLSGRQALRQALTSQIILSNPLAMGEDKSNYTKRLV